MKIRKANEQPKIEKTKEEISTEEIVNEIIEEQPQQEEKIATVEDFEKLQEKLPPKTVEDLEKIDEDFDQLGEDTKGFDDYYDEKENEVEQEENQVLNAITSLNMNFTQFLANQTTEIHAEAIEENLIIKKLSAIKSDTLELNKKKFKTTILEYLLFLLIGVCLGFLDDLWMPYMADFGGVLKEILKYIFK